MLQQGETTMSLTTTILDRDYPTITWPESVDDAPSGWHWGAHVSLGARGTGYYLIRDGGDETVIAIQRPDLSEDDVPSESEILAVINAEEEA